MLTLYTFSRPKASTRTAISQPAVSIREVPRGQSQVSHFTYSHRPRQIFHGGTYLEHPSGSSPAGGASRATQKLAANICWLPRHSEGAWCKSRKRDCKWHQTRVAYDCTDMTKSRTAADIVFLQSSQSNGTSMRGIGCASASTKYTMLRNVRASFASEYLRW